MNKFLILLFKLGSSNNAKFELFIEIAILIDYLISLAVLLVNCFKSPICFLYSIIWSQVKTFITSCFTCSRYFIAFECFSYEFKCIFYEYGLLISLDLLAFAIIDLFIRFIKHNIFNILCFSLFCLYVVYMDFIPLSFFFLVGIAILLFISISYLWSYRSVFKNKVIFCILLASLCIMLVVVLYCIFDMCIEAYMLLTKTGGDSNPGPQSGGPEGNPGGPGGPEGGPEGATVGGIVNDDTNRRSNSDEPSPESETEGHTDPDADAEGETDYDYEVEPSPESKTEGHTDPYANAEGDTEYDCEVEYRVLNLPEPKKPSNRISVRPSKEATSAYNKRYVEKHKEKLEEKKKLRNMEEVRRKAREKYHETRAANKEGINKRRRELRKIKRDNK